VGEEATRVLLSRRLLKRGKDLRRLWIHDTGFFQLKKDKIMFESEYSERGRATNFSNMDERERVLNRFDSINLFSLQDSDEVTPESKVVDVFYHIQACGFLPQMLLTCGSFSVGSADEDLITDPWPRNIFLLFFRL
jgi:hypothetical protein